MATRFIEAWLLPPGSVIVLLVVAAWIVFRVSGKLSAASTETRLLRRTAVGLFVLAGVLYLASTAAVSRGLIGATERRAASGASATFEKAEAVVVLGGGLTVLDDRVRVPRTAYAGEATTATAQLPPEAQARLVEGVLLAAELGVPLVLSGGRVFAAGSVPPEAVVAAELARTLRSDSRATRVELVTETESRSTAENAARVRELLDAQTVVLVTSAYHMIRAERSFIRAGFTVVAAPVAYRADWRPFHPVALLPSADAMLDTATWLRELLGRLWYSLRGV